MSLLLKLALSIPIGIALLYQLLQPEASGGVLVELKVFGAAAFAVVLVFLLLVAFYARDLARTLRMVSHESRVVKPASVWLMFLLPYNFIEDFFIVANVAKSLKLEAEDNPALSRFKSFGLASGITWCSAQIVSLVPNDIGSAAGCVAVIAWVWHWVFIRQANRALVTSGLANNSSQPTPQSEAA
jgi:hypothetical protein